MINVQVNIFRENYLICYDFLGYDINNIFHQKSVQDSPYEVSLSFIDTYQFIFHFLLSITKSSDKGSPK